MSYSERFRQALLRPGKSRAGVAAAMGVSVQAVGQIVRGTTKSATAANNALAAAYFGCDPNWLATGRGTPGWSDEPATLIASEAPRPYGEPPAPPPDFADSMNPSDSEWALLQDIRQLPQQEREQLTRELRARAEIFRAYTAEVLAKVKAKQD